MPKITDAQVEVAEGAYWAVANNSGIVDDKEAYTAAMRAALEAYERVRDVERILQRDYRTEQLQAGRNVDSVEQGLQDVRNKLRKEYPL